MKGNISIVLLLVMIVLLPASVSAYAQNSPATYSVRYAVLTDTGYSVTLPSGQTGMNFTGSPGVAYSSIDADGQTDTTPWAKVNNTGDLSRNFTIGLSANNPVNIILIESNVYDMTGAIELNNTPQILVGGQDVLPDTEFNVFVKADYSAVPLGTNGVYTVSGTIKNYLPALQSITVSYTPTGTIYEGTTKTFRATGLDQYGSVVTISPPVVWESSNTAVGTIDPSSGIFSALIAGSANITATSGSVVGYKLITVQSSGY